VRDTGNDDVCDAGGDDGLPRTTRERVRALADELVATEERPVDPSVSPWLGEAAAVAVDAVDVAVDAEEAAAADAADDVVRERVGHVRDLLSEVEDTGDDEADERVATARRLAAEILAR
jgi:hypothetical protein